MPSPPSSPDSSVVPPIDGQANPMNVDKSGSEAPHPSSTSAAACASRCLAGLDLFVAQIGDCAADPAVAKAVDKIRETTTLFFKDAEKVENETRAAIADTHGLVEALRSGAKAANMSIVDFVAFVKVYKRMYETCGGDQSVLTFQLECELASKRAALQEKLRARKEKEEEEEEHSKSQIEKDLREIKTLFCLLNGDRAGWTAAVLDLNRLEQTAEKLASQEPKLLALLERL